MKIKEQAKSLMYNMDVVHYTDLGKGRMLPVSMHDDQIRQCAITAIEYIMEEIRNTCDEEIVVPRLIYWKKVKKEIEKL